jgi:hypothetical protein
MRRTAGKVIRWNERVRGRARRDEAPRESDAPRDMMLARAVRALRENPSAPSGPLALQYVVVMLHAIDQGLTPGDDVRLPPGEAIELMKTVLWFLYSFSVDLKLTDPQTSDDATWALAQAGVTPVELQALPPDEAARRIEDLARRTWS